MTPHSTSSDLSPEILWRRTTLQPLRLHHYLIAFLLAGYLFADKGFAYLHIPGTPIYIGDAVCLFSIAWIVLFTRPLARWAAADALPIAAMLAYAGLRLLPDIPAYGALALRDSVPLTYGYVAFLAYFVVRDRSDVQVFLRVLAVALLLHTALTPLYLAVGLYQTTLPWSRVVDVSLLLFKPTDHCNFAALAIAFMLTGKGIPLRLPRWMPMGVVILNFAYITLTLIRGAYLGLAAVLAQLLILGSARRHLVVLLAILAGLSGLLLIGPSVTIGGRVLSADVLSEEVQSIFVDRPFQYAFTSTKEWRLEFWKSIIAESLKRPGTFFFGIGNGPNLASLHGFTSGDPNAPFQLRSPHSIAMTIYARFGLLGVLVWLAVHARYFLVVVPALRRCTSAQATDLTLGLWVSLSYVTMTLVNASFDVMLESPQTAIWYWLMIGFGFVLGGFTRQMTSQSAGVQPDFLAPSER